MHLSALCTSFGLPNKLQMLTSTIVAAHSALHPFPFLVPFPFPFLFHCLDNHALAFGVSAAGVVLALAAQDQG